MKKSQLQIRPKSVVMKKGYLNIYSRLNAGERRYVDYNCEYKEIDKGWDNTFVRLCKWFGEISRNKKDLAVLDAGCGNGNYIIDEFRKKISWAAGVDLNREATKKNICLDEIKYANLEAIPYPDNSFEVVISLWVIEHLKNPEKVFNEIYRVLKPGGILLLATPNRKFWLIELKNWLSVIKINKLTERVYGREEKDIFPTYYRANELLLLGKVLSLVGFRKIDLDLNYDPAYTSFNQLSFSLSNLIYRISKSDNWKAHIVGKAEK